MAQVSMTLRWGIKINAYESFTLKVICTTCIRDFLKANNIPKMTKYAFLSESYG